MSVKQKVIVGVVAGVFLVGIAGAFNFASNHQITRNSSETAAKEEQQVARGESVSQSSVTASSENVITVKSKADAEKMLEETETSFGDLDSAFAE